MRQLLRADPEFYQFTQYIRMKVILTGGSGRWLKMQTTVTIAQDGPRKVGEL